MDYLNIVSFNFFRHFRPNNFRSALSKRAFFIIGQLQTPTSTSFVKTVVIANYNRTNWLTSTSTEVKTLKKERLRMVFNLYMIFMQNKVFFCEIGKT